MKTNLMILCVASLASSACSGETRMESYQIEEEVFELRIFSTEGNVSIKTGTAAAISISVLIEGEDTKVEQGITDQVLSLNTRCGGGWLSSCAVDYEVTVPETLNVWVDAGSGNATLVGLKADAVLISGSGNIEVESYASESLEFDAGSGDFRGTGIAASRLEGVAGSGNIAVNFNGPPDIVSLQAGSGDISISVPAESYDVQTNSDDISISGIVAQSGAVRKLILSAGSGRIRVTGN